MSNRNTERRATPRRPGRPSGNGNLQARLLLAARREFAEHGFRGTSVAAIARAAGVTPAMANYYFGSKRGLYRAMLEDTLAPMVERMRDYAERALTDDDPIASFVHAYMALLAARPAIPALLLRDVLGPGGEMRDELVSGFASRGAATLRQLIRDGIERGRLRADLDPDLAGLSLLSLAAFPFLAAPVARRVFAYDTGTQEVERLAEHTLELFYRGTAARP